MKISKSLFLAFAGLGLFACSNEDVTENGGIEGVKNVVVKIDVEGINSFSRNAGISSFGSTVAVAGSLEVILDATAVNGSNTQTVSITDGEVENVVFQGVENPQSVTVKVNGYDGTPLTTLTAANAAAYQDLKAPMYGQASGVVLSTATAEEKKGKIVKEEDGNYSVTFDLEPVVGRLEFSGIVHETHNDPDKCLFTSDLKLKQIDLVNGSDIYKEPSFTQPALFTPGTSFPEEGCYAYNVVNGTLPILRLTFSDVTYSNDGAHAGDVWVGNPEGQGYAVIEKYKLADGTSEEIKRAFGAGTDNVISKFPAGYIYQISSLTVADEKIHGEPTGDGVTLTAVITVDAWTLVTGSAEWK